MTEELKVLYEVTALLEGAAFPYMLTGSVAMHFYAAPRMTRDIDIVIQAKEEDVKRLLNLFEKDYYIDDEAVSQAIQNKTLFNIIHNSTVVKIDLIIKKNTDYREMEFTRKKKMELGYRAVWVVTPEDLILSKLQWASDSKSEMQIGDIKNLISMVEKLDHEYINTWVKKLDLTDIYKKAVK